VIEPANSFDALLDHLVAELPRSTGRSRSFLATEAISAYLDDNEWQISGIAAALSSLDRGEGIPHKRVKEWAASWETKHERPSP
jgi:predicted transcriptional regulator